VDDVNLRLEFHRALDAVTPPAPWLGQRMREELRTRSRESWIEGVRRRPTDLAWVLPVIAVLLALAIIVTLMVGSHLLPKSVPANPHSGAAPACPTWGFIPGGGAAPISIDMASVTTGWAPGDLRTTDGGAHWTDVSPKALRAGEPNLPGQQTVYPPTYTDFFLDADHAWLARTYESSKACIDHITVFRTVDGGQTWHTSAPIAPRLSPGSYPQLVLTFVDAQHGWLMVTATKASLMYRTQDGGQTWRDVSSAGPQCAAMIFSTTSIGWSSCGSAFGGGPVATLSVTHDGGVTWQDEALPTSQGCQCSVGLPIFFDAMHGAARGYGNNGDGIYTTSDGGVTWRVTAFAVAGTAFAPGGFEPYPAIVGFEDPANFWIFTTPPGWDKGGVPTDWLYHSADGGATWQLVQRDTLVAFPSSPVGISFPDSMHGYVVQTDQNGAPQVAATSDGGHTWRLFQVQVS
jgi:photosystem II stability/assembly factor-like uncharacterized protein